MPDRQSRRQSVRPVRSERSETPAESKREEQEEGKSVKPTLGRSGTASSVALHSTENNYINDFESACLEEGKSLPTWLEARKKYEQQSEFTEVAGELEEIIGKIMTNDGLEEDDRKKLFERFEDNKSLAMNLCKYIVYNRRKKGVPIDKIVEYSSAKAKAEGLINHYKRHEYYGQGLIFDSEAVKKIDAEIEKVTKEKNGEEKDKLRQGVIDSKLQEAIMNSQGGENEETKKSIIEITNTLQEHKHLIDNLDRK